MANSGADAARLAQEVLGYLNFSSGAPDPHFVTALDSLARCLDRPAPAAATETRSGRVKRPASRGAARESSAVQDAAPLWKRLAAELGKRLAELRQSSDAFRDSRQADEVLRLVFDVVLPAYRAFHHDVLAHQDEEFLFQPFFIGRTCEAVLAQGGPWDESERIQQGAIKQLNDFIGYRPVAVLRTAQKIQPYAHEWVRPIPLYVRQAGTAAGRFEEVVAGALELLRQTDPAILEAARFDPDLLDELAIDPRAYDFDHPVNMRPNYLFGCWDPHRIDNRGFYRRYVVQQVTIDALTDRIAQRRDLPRDEVLFEAAAVLAGTILMGSGISGSGPECYDSTVTLGNLVPQIAAYRDAFYERLIAGRTGRHLARLQREAAQLRQPFGGARQHLNQALARRRADQLQHVHLAHIYARMGYADPARRHAETVRVASARMRCDMQCRMTEAHRAVEAHDLARGAALAADVESLLHRAVECGATVDPWNILGFGGQYARFPGVEDSAPDHRVDQLLETVNDLFGLQARLLHEAAAAGNAPVQTEISLRMDQLAVWWDRFAVTEVADVDGFSGREAWQSAEQVAAALALWKQAGTAAGNVAFWRQHAEGFRSPKAYALLVEALLDHGDLVAAMALLIHWLGQAEEIRLAQGHHAFHTLAVRWMEKLWSEKPPDDRSGRPETLEQRWSLGRKFLDFLEANAESFWEVPRLEIGGVPVDAGAEPPEDETDDDADGLYGAAYENVTYRDTTDDGVDADMIEGAAIAGDFELSREAERIVGRLAFLITTGRLWRRMAAASLGKNALLPDREDAIAGWMAHVLRRRQAIAELLGVVHRYAIPAPASRYDALVEFDQRQAVKESLIDRIVAAGIETADIARQILAVCDGPLPDRGLAAWEIAAVELLRAAFRGDAAAAQENFGPLVEQLAAQTVLYVPVSRGGNPQRIVAARNVLQVVRQLLAALPRLGLVDETLLLLETAQTMERQHPAGAMAVTEFDGLFETAGRGILQCLTATLIAEPPAARKRSPKPAIDRFFRDLLEPAIEALLRRWLAHNRHVRLSVLEQLDDDESWGDVCTFIRVYGQDLFSQRFLAYGNIRAILHQGVDTWIDGLLEDEDAAGAFRFLADIPDRLSRDDAVRWIETSLEAVLEDYNEYRDYNTTTTQSDRGEMLFVLLDFLRVKASYDRVNWNLYPVFLAHRVLIESGFPDVAARWSEAIADRTRAIAIDHVQRFEKLCAQYGVRLRTVGERVGERFIQPLAVDRLRALVLPAVRACGTAAAAAAFAQLEVEVAHFTAEPAGVGIDVPAWLEALEDEVHKAQAAAEENDDDLAGMPVIPQKRLSRETLRRLLRAWQDDE